MKTKILHYNSKKFNFKNFFCRKTIFKDLGYELRNVKKKKIEKIIEKIKKNLEFNNTYKEFIKKEIQILFKEKIVYQKYPNIRVLMPDDESGVVPFHCDKWYNHTDDEINFWIPMHEVNSSESLQLVNLKDSLILQKKIIKDKVNYIKIKSLIKSKANPIKCQYGEMLKFSPQHLHGSIINKTNNPRISIDFRVKKLNSIFKNKTLGGYYEII
tara:strand:- start:1391 stop:2029 length:639 start_codon:yes stop_codon:yes gene_type:complete